MSRRILELRSHFDAAAWQVASSSDHTGTTVLLTWSVLLTGALRWAELDPVPAGPRDSASPP